jgi:hypothetical protein
MSMEVIQLTDGVSPVDVEKDRAHKDKSEARDDLHRHSLVPSLHGIVVCKIKTK